MNSGLLSAIFTDQVFVLGLLFAAVLLTVLGISWLIRPRSSVERRLVAGSGSFDSQQAIPEVVLRRSDRRGILNSLDHWLEPSQPEGGKQLRERLAFAGYRGPGAVRNWFLSRIALSLGLP